MQLLYNIAGIIIVILIIPMFMVRAVREKGFVERIRQSMGFFPEHTLDKVEKKDCIWVHAASVGEIVATSPLIKEFRREFPKSPILVSVVTTSGYEMANRIIKDADAIIYFPLDLPWLLPATCCAASGRASSCQSRRSSGRTSCARRARSTCRS